MGKIDMSKLLFSTILTCSIFANISAQAEPFTYAPDFCDMQVTFPEKPFIETKCLNAGAERNCTDIVTFKKIAPPDASVNFRVTCVEYTPEELATYTNEIVEKTLEKLLSDQGFEAYDVSSDDVDDVRRSTTMSVGTKDNIPYIYSGQIWIGKKSMFTIEAQMKGDKNDDIEATFANILRETYPVGLKLPETKTIQADQKP